MIYYDRCINRKIFEIVKKIVILQDFNFLKLVYKCLIIKTLSSFWARFFIFRKKIKAKNELNFKLRGEESHFIFRLGMKNIN